MGRDASAESQGDHIYISDALDYELTVKDSTFTGRVGWSSAIYLENTNLVMTRSTARDIERDPISQNTIKGGLVRCENCGYATFTKNNFYKVKSGDYGGIIYIDQKDQYKDGIPDTPRYLIDNCTFSENEGGIGVSIYN